MNRREPENWQRADGLLNQGNHREALELYKQMAERNVPGACAEIAIQYELGIEDEQPDIEKAVSWFDEGIRRDETESMIGIGRLILSGKTVSCEYEYAFELYGRAVERVESPRALFGLGCLHYDGLGVERNTEVALSYYVRADRVGHVLARARMANIYRENGQWTRFLGLRISAFGRFLRSLFGERGLGVADDIL